MSERYVLRMSALLRCHGNDRKDSTPWRDVAAVAWYPVLPENFQDIRRPQRRDTIEAGISNAKTPLLG
jgi:hypothetical protein